MINKQKLELTWIGKDKQVALEPRILIEDPEKSYGDPHSENMLIHGDNLLALKALEQKFAGKIKCIFIDPPYNTGSAFEHYDDGVEHSLWLSLIRDRLVILKNLLSKDGSLWITIDDNESHYLKVLCDEIFGRRSYIASMVWEKDAGRKNDTAISTSHDYILLYAPQGKAWKDTRNLLEHTAEQLKRYQNPDNDPRGPWRQGADGTAKSGSETLRYPIEVPSGRIVTPPSGNFWRFSRTTFETALSEERVYFGKDGNRLPIIKKYLSDIQGGIVPKTWWPYSEVGSNQEARRDHLRKLLPDIEPFSTPKPERLLARIIQIATNPGDIVLDSFLGSGTTATVAHKMGRKWIGVELGNHCDTHCIPRLKKVVNGQDLGGITFTSPPKPKVKLCKQCKDGLCEKCEEKFRAATKPEQVWFGGGGFKYYDLAPSLLKQDKHGNFVISDEYNPDMLAAAMAKQEGFTFSPDQELYWKQGYSTEQDFIFTTTSHVTAAMLDTIAEEMAEGEHLLICCKKFDKACDGRHINIQIKKIPSMLMGRCEFGKEDYSLNIVNLTDAENAPEFVPEGPGEELKKKSPVRKHGTKNPRQRRLF